MNKMFLIVALVLMSCVGVLAEKFLVVPDGFTGLPIPPYSDVAGAVSNITGNIPVHGVLVPTTSNTLDIGTPLMPFRNVYMSNVVVQSMAIGTNAPVQGTILMSTFAIGTMRGVSTNVTITTTSTNFSLIASKPSVDVLRGGVFNICTNIFSKTFTLTYYAASDYKATNAYWRASMALVASPLSVSNAIGSYTAAVADVTGFVANDYVYFQSTGERARISSNLVNTLFFEDPLIQNHAAGEGVSRIAEFGGFTMWNSSGATNMYGRLTSTTAATCTNTVEIFYRE